MCGREHVLDRVDKNLQEIGLTKEFVNSHTIYQLEEAVGLGHYRFSGSSESQTGYIPLSTYLERKSKIRM